MTTTMYTIAEAARHIGVTDRTIRNLIRAGHLTVHRRDRDRRKYCDPAEVEELRVERDAGNRTVVSREDFGILRGQVRRLQATMDAVLRILNSQDAPLSMTPEYAEKVYVLCLAQLREGGWTPEEMEAWLEIFLRMSEDDIRQMHLATHDSKPWIHFLKLVSSMTAWVVGSNDYKTSLELQSLHMKLAEARRRLRTSAVIYVETYGGTDPALDKYKDMTIPSSITELLEGALRRKK